MEILTLSLTCLIQYMIIILKDGFCKMYKELYFS